MIEPAVTSGPNLFSEISAKTTTAAASRPNLLSGGTSGGASSPSFLNAFACLPLSGQQVVHDWHLMEYSVNPVTPSIVTSK
jgi:hypothetical protein